jgi:tetratricopeptide (TPR) repeat protein
MSRLFFALSVVCALAGISAGCGNHRSPADIQAGRVDLDAVIARADEQKRPLVILVGDFGSSGADRAADTLFDHLASITLASTIQFLKIDLANSANRANAARFHLAQTPVLVCLSPMGIIVSRDQGPITAQLVSSRIDALQRRSDELDTKFISLLNRSPDKMNNALDYQYDLAEFLLAQKNEREAIPYLAELADPGNGDTDVRIHSWVEMARAHLWIGEPEKARHEAKDLIATLGPQDPDAIAGGNLVLGSQDIAAKRFSLARQEFESAVKADPASVYAKQARDEIAQLPKESK